MINGTFQNPGLNQVEASYEKSGGFNPNSGTAVKDARCPASYIKETLQIVIVRHPFALVDYVCNIRKGPTGKFDPSYVCEVASVGNGSPYRAFL